MTQRIGTDNEQFGINLLEDDDGSIVNDIKGDGLHKIPLITLEIVRMWLRGIGKKPVTWATLVGVLERIRLRALATEIRESPQVKLGIVYITVEPPNNGRENFVHCSEVVPSSEVEMYTGRGLTVCPL